MAFHVFANDSFAYPHETTQCRRILDFLKSLYETDPDNFCYCLFNREYHDANGDVRGQYDLLIFTNHSISIVELKAKRGKLIGHPNKNYGNNDLLLIYPSRKQEFIPLSQVENQQKHLKERLVNDFRYAMKKQNDHYRIDSFLLFDEPLDLNDFSIENEQIKKWLKVMTITTFINEWKLNMKTQPFTLTEKDICFLAEQGFRLHEVATTDYKTNISSIGKRIEDFLVFESEDAYRSLDYTMIRREVLEMISEEEFHELISMRKNIFSLSDVQKERYRNIASKLKAPYLSYARLNQFFLGQVLHRLKNISVSATTAFEKMPDAVKNMDMNNPIVPRLTDLDVGATIDEMKESMEEIRQLLYDYQSFCEIKFEIWGKSGNATKESNRAALLIDICQKMELNNE